MRFQLSLRSKEHSSGVDLVIDAQPETPTSQLLETLGVEPDCSVFVRGGRLRTDGSLAESGLLDGDELGFAWASGTIEPYESSPLEIAVVDGPDAGCTYPWSKPSLTVGRSSDCDIRLNDAMASGRHAVFSRANDQLFITDTGSSNGIRIEGVEVASGETLITPEASIEIGSSVLSVRAGLIADADLQPDGELGLRFNRPARLRPPQSAASVDIPQSPRGSDPWPFPWLQAILPLVIAVGGAFLFKQPQILLFAVLSPVMTISSALSSRRQSKRRSGKDAVTFDKRMIAVRDTITTAIENQTAIRRRQYPDPTTVSEIARGPNRRLWERRFHDTDAFVLRLGVGDAPADIELRGGGEESDIAWPQLRMVPITIDLKRAGVLGICGPQSRVDGVARWLVMQLAVLHSPSDLQITYTTCERAPADWNWLRWIPHAHPNESAGILAYVGNDRVTREERLRELTRTLDSRLEAGRTGQMHLPVIVAIFDGARVYVLCPESPSSSETVRQLGSTSSPWTMIERDCPRKLTPSWFSSTLMHRLRRCTRTINTPKVRSSRILSHQCGAGRLHVHWLRSVSQVETGKTKFHGQCGSSTLPNSISMTQRTS